MGSEEAIGTTGTLHTAVLESLRDRIAVVDRRGVIIAVNTAWAEFDRHHRASGHVMGPGVNYLHECDAVASTSMEPSAVSEGIEGVCTGRWDSFETVYFYDESGKERCCVMTATPLRRAAGGALITHIDMTPSRVAELAVRMSEALLRRAADAVPIPMSIGVAAKLVAAQEAERSHIARELHDDLGQQIAVLASRLDALLRERTRSATRLRTGLAEAQASLQDIAAAVHGLSHRLHPAKLRLLGLVQTLEILCRDVSSESGVPVTFEAGRIQSHSNEAIALCIFRVAQEALQNAVKHSGAKTIHVRLNGTSSALALRVTDDGHGFDPVVSQSAGLGLLTMRERVELSGGRLKIETAHARGTTIMATIPLPHTSARTWRPTRPAGVAPRQARARVRRLPSAS